MTVAFQADITRRGLLGAATALLLMPPGLALAAAKPKGRRRKAGITACPVPAMERRVPARGGALYARANGAAGAAAPALLVHGGPGGTHLGMVGALPLADTRQIILYDQLDCGRSDRPGRTANWSVDRFVSEIDAMRAAFDLDEFHLVGCSWGGTLALEYAARRPEGLKSLALFSPLVSTRAWLADAEVHIGNLPAKHQAAIAEARRTGNYDSFTFQEADQIYSSQHLSREPLSPLHLACQGRRDTGFNIDLYNHMWGPSEFTVTGTLGSYDGEHLLPRVAVPTLIAGGEHDEARPATLKDFTSRVPDARYEMIKGSGHWIENDRPEAYRKVLRAWLESRD
jgi:proline iminopeptidase/L-proline amide hydrolase